MHTTPVARRLVSGNQSVVIDRLNIQCVAILPHEADAPLVVDAHAPWPASLAFECFQAVPWGTRKMVMDGAASINLSLRRAVP